MTYTDRYNKWLNSEVIDEETKQQIRNMTEDEKELSFFKELEFGTAGLRAIMGIGTNRMNKYTIVKTTEGVANYILKKGFENRSAVIAYDSRHNSKEFAETAALVLNKRNIKTYIFDSLMSTPVLAYACLFLKTSVGINITSSHNAKEYNGYKIYNSEGHQFTSPEDTEIMNEINSIDEYPHIDLTDISVMIEKGLFNYVDDEVLESFVKETKQQIKKRYDDNRNLKIVYTALHGTGTKLMARILNEVGFVNVYNVLEQRYPDADFKTTPYPNPEDLSTFDIAIEVARKKDADIIIASDPDADRVGIMVKSDYGEYIPLSGNQVGALIGSYVLSNTENLSNGVIIRSIVTGKLIDAVATDYNIKVEEVYTGPKYIGEKIAEYDKTGENKYIFGFEESIGYLVGNYVRDKNGFSAALVFCELCEVLKDHGIGILEYLEDFYKKYGYYSDKSFSVEYDGIDAMDQMAAIMDRVRESHLTSIGSYNINTIEDFLSGEAYHCRDDTYSDIEFPPSNVLRFTLEDGSWFAIRPSGTEPKIKVYMEAIDTSQEISLKKLEEIEKGIKNLIKWGIENELQR